MLHPVFLSYLFQQKEYLQKNRGSLLLFVFIGVIKNCASFLLSVSIGEFFSLKFHSSGSKGKLLEMFGIKLHSLEAFFTFFVCLIFFRAILEYLENYLISVQGERFVWIVRKKIFQQQLSWDSERFRSKHFSNYLLRYSNDMKAIQHYLSKGIMGGIKDIIFILMGLSLLAIISGQLAFFYALMILVSVGIVILLAKKQRKLISESRSRRSNLLSLVTKSFQRHKKIKEASEEDATLSKFDTSADSLYKANIVNHRFESMLFSLFSFLQYFMIAIVLLLMGNDRHLHIHHSSGLVFILIIMLMNANLKRVLKVPAIINKGIVSFKKIESILQS